MQYLPEYQKYVTYTVEAASFFRTLGMLKGLRPLKKVCLQIMKCHLSLQM